MLGFGDMDLRVWKVLRVGDGDNPEYGKRRPDLVGDGLEHIGGPDGK